MNQAPSLDISVVLADDHQLMREGLRRLLGATPGMHVAGEAGSGHEVLELLRRVAVDVAVLDLSMPGMTGMDLIRRVKTEFPHVAVLVLTMHAEEQYAMRAFRCGASGYLTKDSAGDELVQAIRKVAGGGGYVTAALAERLAMGLSTLREAPRHAGLTDREFEVFRRIVAGQRLTDIADELHLSIKTVSTHKARVLEKMGLDSTAALIRYGLENRLFEDAAGA
ncbi:MAG: response regulator transcription factor [Burkholderiales bacterium]|nr:response regulator transcription factor [Burkholderiales bacterium]